MSDAARRPWLCWKRGYQWCYGACCHKLLACLAARGCRKSLEAARRCGASAGTPAGAAEGKHALVAVRVGFHKGWRLRLTNAALSLGRLDHFQNAAPASTPNYHVLARLLIQVAPQRLHMRFNGCRAAQRVKHAQACGGGQVGEGCGLLSEVRRTSHSEREASAPGVVVTAAAGQSLSATPVQGSAAATLLVRTVLEAQDFNEGQSAVLKTLQGRSAQSDGCEAVAARWEHTQASPVPGTPAAMRRRRPASTGLLGRPAHLGAVGQQGPVQGGHGEVGGAAAPKHLR